MDYGTIFTKNCFDIKRKLVAAQMTSMEHTRIDDENSTNCQGQVLLIGCLLVEHSKHGTDFAISISDNREFDLSSVNMVWQL